MRGAALAALALALAASVAACGSSSFPNDPRPPAPIDVAAKIDANRVAVSPDSFGAGLVTFSVANFSKSPVRFEISGPKHATTAEIKPGQPGSLQVELPQGAYRAQATGLGAARPASFTVGRKRPSSENKLLLP